MEGSGRTRRSTTVRPSGSSATSSHGSRSSGATGAPGSDPAKSLVTSVPSGRITKLL